jgi:hypothetical protein
MCLHLRFRQIIFIALPVMVLINACKKDEQQSTPPPVVAPEAPIRPTTARSNAYVTSFFEYNPAPGQFLNTSLANDSNARTILGNTQGLLTLGGWGGYVVYGFDHTVIDTAGPDLLVIGNAFAQFAEPGVVWVMQDLNGNGKPDDTWYELAGSETGRPGYIRNYSVTYTRPTPANGSVPWKDNQGDTGSVQTNIFNTGDYYPDNLVADSYTLSGTLLPSTNIDMTDPSYITSASFSYGYCDNSAGGDPVDISMAIDSAGRSVMLKGIDFVKIQTGILYNMGWLGEQSTEVAGIGDISLIH